MIYIKHNNLMIVKGKILFITTCLTSCYCKGQYVEDNFNNFLLIAFFLLALIVCLCVDRRNNYQIVNQIMAKILGIRNRFKSNRQKNKKDS
jgi:hypothetical protein